MLGADLLRLPDLAQLNTQQYGVLRDLFFFQKALAVEIIVKLNYSEIIISKYRILLIFSCILPPRAFRLRTTYYPHVLLSVQHCCKLYYS